MRYNSYEIGQRIFIARNRAGLKQEALGVMMGIHQTTISDIENGKTHITVQSLYKASEVLGVPVDWLLGETFHCDDLTESENLEMQIYKKFIKNKRI